MITQILLQYNRSIYTTALYIIYLDLTFAPIFSSTFRTIPHHLRALNRLWYRATQLLLLYPMVNPK